MKHSTGYPTKAQAERFVRIKLDSGCVCCRIRGIGYVQPDIHHLGVGRRDGHDATIGLCQWHHRGIPPEGWTPKTYIEFAGPSLARGSKPFHAEFGSDEELLAMQNSILEAAT